MAGAAGGEEKSFLDGHQAPRGSTWGRADLPEDLANERAGAGST